jgi:hypothetical protein
MRDKKAIANKRWEKRMKQPFKRLSRNEGFATVLG